MSTFLSDFLQLLHICIYYQTITLRYVSFQVFCNLEISKCFYEIIKWENQDILGTKSLSMYLSLLQNYLRSFAFTKILLSSHFDCTTTIFQCYLQKFNRTLQFYRSFSNQSDEKLHSLFCLSISLFLLTQSKIISILWRDSQ